MNGDLVIQATGLEKRYGAVRALDGLDLTVSAGEVHGFLGPNGAGKSTTIRIILGLARATGGSISVFGHDPFRDAARLHRRIASVPGDVSLWPNLSGGAMIDFLARLRGTDTSGQPYRTERARLIEVFQFDPRPKGRSYSKGNRQKVALIAAFAVPADLYVLDEPTSGLDPYMEVRFREEIDRVRQRGAAVLLSSHILAEVEQLCDRVSIIRAGRLVDSGSLDELRRVTRSELSFTEPPNGALPTLPGVADLTVSGGRVRCAVPGDEIADLLPALAAARVEGLRIEPTTLESLLLHHYDTGGDGGGTSGESGP